jgi:predicted AlkP superfamily pyrophosphatase or phosphodiesterase
VEVPESADSRSLHPERSEGPTRDEEPVLPIEENGSRRPLPLGINPGENPGGRDPPLEPGDQAADRDAEHDAKRKDAMSMQASGWSAICQCFLTTTVLGGCAPAAREAPAPDDRGRATLVLVSLDGFRWDYLDRGLTPNLSRLAQMGVRAEALVPVFPTKTFPNHYTIVTGRYPAKHGIMGNVFTAPDIGGRLTLWDREAVRDARFYLAEPIWVTAERQGQRTAPLFWPGSEAPISGVRPSYNLPFDGEMPDTARVRRLLEWLDLPLARRPTFLTLYSSAVDNAGHDYGPDTPETNRAIAQVDSLIGLLAAALAARGSANLVIVSDHGMASTGPDRVIWLDDVVSADAMQVDEMSSLLTAWPAEGLEDSVYRGLKRAPHLVVYRRAELPARFHLAGGPRVAPIVAIADEGWTIAQRASSGQPTIILGNHGFDDTLSSMRAIFIAHGPAFRRGLTVSPFRSIHVYSLLAEVLGVTPAPTDGSLDSVRVMLARPDGMESAY